MCVHNKAWLHFQVSADPSCLSLSFHLSYMKVLLQRNQAHQGPAWGWLSITASPVLQIKFYLTSDPSAFLNVLIWSANIFHLQMWLWTDPWCSGDSACSFHIKDRSVPSGFPGSVRGHKLRPLPKGCSPELSFSQRYVFSWAFIHSAKWVPITSAPIFAEGARDLDGHMYRPEWPKF